MNKTVGLIAGMGLLAVLGGGSLLAAYNGRSSVKHLIGEDLGRVRHEALTLFPRGVPVAQAAQGLQALGFLCAPAHRLLANVNAPSVECNSAGRGFPTTSRMEVTVLARNGTLSDIAIGSGVDSIVADARTPNPQPGTRLP